EGVDGTVEFYALDALDEIKLTALVDHHHPGTYRRCRHERHGVLGLADAVRGCCETRREAHPRPSRFTQLRHGLGDPSEIRVGCFKAPAVRSAVGRANRQAQALDGTTSRLVITEQ